MNKKVKLICEMYDRTFEASVNQFLATHTVLDIQYQVKPSGCYTALITYEEW